MLRFFRSVGVASLVAAASLSASLSHAAGLYKSPRGVRPASRGGAFVAGADDLNATWYNPAGVFDAGASLLIDASVVNFNSAFTRRSIVKQRDPNTGEVLTEFQKNYPTADGSGALIPIPTLAGSFFLDERWVLAFSAFAPNSAIANYDEQSAAKYSLVSLEGSALVMTQATIAFAPNKQWRFGASLGVLVGSFNNVATLSACIPERFICAPEDPSWDSLAQLSIGPIFAPTGNLGVIYRPNPMVSIGASFQLPVWVRSGGSLSVRLPSTPVFDEVKQEGSDVDVALNLPWVARLGVEVRPIDRLRIELAGVIEGWSIHDEIAFSPQGVTLRNVPGFPDPYPVPKNGIVRNFTESFALRLGGEYGLPIDDDLGLMFRLGAYYESSAVPNAYVSPLTIDSDKIGLAAGATFRIGDVSIDATYSRVIPFGVTVAPEDAAVPVVSPVEANVSDPQFINGGDYSYSVDVIGLGFRYTFEASPDSPAATRAAERKQPGKAKRRRATPTKKKSAKTHKRPTKPTVDDDDDDFGDSD